MKTRIIHTRIWTDSFFESLSPQEKLLFIFFITNENIGLTGAYECTDRAIAYHTGLSSGEITKGKEKFKQNFEFVDSWVYLKNAVKYQNYKSNEKLLKAYTKEFDSLPVKVQKLIKNDTSSDTGIHTLLNNKSEIINHKKENIKTEVEKKQTVSNHLFGVKNEAKILADKMDMNKKKSGIHTQWQDDAFRFAEQLGIKLDDVSLKGRWLKFFKMSYEKKMSNKIKTTYSNLVDYIPFQAIKTAEGKVKYFFAVFSK